MDMVNISLSVFFSDLLTEQVIYARAILTLITEEASPAQGIETLGFPGIQLSVYAGNSEVSIFLYLLFSFNS